MEGGGALVYYAPSSSQENRNHTGTVQDKETTNLILFSVTRPSGPNQSNSRNVRDFEC